MRFPNKKNQTQSRRYNKKTKVTSTGDYINPKVRALLKNEPIQSIKKQKDCTVKA